MFKDVEEMTEIRRMALSTAPLSIRLSIRQWRIINEVELVETSVFTRQITEFLDDDEYRRFQNELAANPARGPVIRGGGGIRKVRVALGSRGKSGGARVIYYWVVRRNLILLLYAFPKNVAADLTARQTAQLAKAVKEEFGDEE